LFKSKILLLGVLCVLPSIIWYTYSHKLYLLFGNSLGLTNQYPWIGWDFFTNPSFVKGIALQEISHVWTFFGPLIIILALISSRTFIKQSIVFPICWLFSALVFYIIAARTTADDWAFYYHIFSVPSASILLGISVTGLYDKYIPSLSLKSNKSFKELIISESSLILSVLFILVLSYTAFSFRYLVRSKPAIFRTCAYYECKNSLSDIIPKGSLILATGEVCISDNYPAAYNASYFFYWLDLKGYNICIEDQSIENVLMYRENGAYYYIAETQALQKKQGFEVLLRKSFKPVLECNGIILFELK
jgi:hypothetical protein